MHRYVKCVMVLGWWCCAGSVLAQNTVNYWMGGDHSMIRFEGDTAFWEYRPSNENFWRTSSSISDTNGSLLFYTNGYRVFNKNHEYLQGSSTLDIGAYEDWGYDLLALGDGALILPVPGNDHRYFLFHFDLNYTTVPELPNGLWPTHLFYCLVDMTLDNGNGGIATGQNDLILFSDTLTQMGLKAVKHGNGRDWWILTHEYGTNRYYRFLIDPFGIHGPYSQDIGFVFNLGNAVTSSVMKFSQDGQRFLASTFNANIFELYDFDRCSGLLFNRVEVPITTPDDSSINHGCCFSPSGQYVYISHNHDEVLQFDSYAADIASSRTVVGADDGIGDPFAANFAYLEIGQDEKVWVQDYNGCYSLSVINHPDSAGVACDFVQRGFDILNGSPDTLWEPVAVNAPNYSLGPLYGSGCDTVTKADALPAPAFTFGVYPNPFAGELQVAVTGALTLSAKATIQVTNVLGQTVYEATAQPQNHFVHFTLDLSGSSAGVYFINLEVDNQRHCLKAVKVNNEQ